MRIRVSYRRWGGDRCRTRVYRRASRSCLGVRGHSDCHAVQQDVPHNVDVPSRSRYARWVVRGDSIKAFDEKVNFAIRQA